MPKQMKIVYLCLSGGVYSGKRGNAICTNCKKKRDTHGRLLEMYRDAVIADALTRGIIQGKDPDALRVIIRACRRRLHQLEGKDIHE